MKKKINDRLKFLRMCLSSTEGEAAHSKRSLKDRCAPLWLMECASKVAFFQVQKECWEREIEFLERLLEDQPACGKEMR